MKKVLTLLFTLAMVVSMGLSVFATGSIYMESPTKKPTPQVVEVQSSTPNFEPSRFAIMSFNNLVSSYHETKDGDYNGDDTHIDDRDDKNEAGGGTFEIPTLPPAEQKEFNESYEALTQVGKMIDEIIPEIVEVIKEVEQQIAEATGEIKEIKKEYLSIADMFFLSYSDVKDVDPTASDAAEGKAYNLSFQSDSFENFVALTNYVDGEWKIVEGATVDETNTLTFSTDTLGSFAVIADAEDILAPQTTNTALIVGIVVASVVVVCAIAVVAVIVVKKKKNVKAA